MAEVEMTQKIGEVSIGLECQMTPEEVAAASEELAGLYLNAVRSEVEMKDAMKAMREANDARWEEVDAAAEQVQAGTMKRLVKCELRLTGDIVETVRTDTGDVVATREATAGERNLPLPLEGGDAP